MGETATNQGDMEQWLDSVMDTAKEQRLSAEIKWNGNRATRHADASLDSSGKWKRYEKVQTNPKGQFKADTFFGIIKQKCITAHAIFTDEVLKGGQLPYMLAMRDEGRKTDLLENDPDAMKMVDNEIEHASKRLQRQFENCEASDEVSKIADDNIGYGECWAHTYVTDMVSTRYIEVAPGLYDPVIESESTKGVEHVSIWEMFRDMESKTPEGGQYVIRQRMESAYDIRQLSDKPNFIPVKIKQVLADLPNTPQGDGSNQAPASSNSLPPYLRNITNRKKTVEKREFWALCPTRKAMAFEAMIPALLATEDPANIPAAQQSVTTTEDQPAGDMVRCLITTANSLIIQFKRDPGKIPYNRVEWEPDNDSPNGRGIPDNMEATQKTLNGMIRSVEDNTKLLANLMVAIRENFFEGDISDVFKEGGIMKLTNDADGVNLSEAIMQFKFNDITGSLYKGIEMFLEFADMESQVPRASQGQQSANPQTAYELQQRLERAGKYIGNAIRRFDKLIRWIVDDFHTYNMANPEITDGKGDFIVKALGFTSFQNRVIKLQKLMQMLTIIISNEELTARAKLTWLLNEIAKALDLDPDELWKSEEQMVAENQAKQESVETQLQLAQAQLALQIGAAGLEKTGAETGKIQAETESELAAIDQKQQEIDNERAALIAKIEQDDKPEPKTKAASERE